MERNGVKGKDLRCSYLNKIRDDKVNSSGNKRNEFMNKYYKWVELLWFDKWLDVVYMWEERIKGNLRFLVLMNRRMVKYLNEIRYIVRKSKFLVVVGE